MGFARGTVVGTLFMYSCFWCVSFSFMEPATVAAQGAVCSRVFGVLSNALDAALLRRRLSGAVLWLGLCHVPPTTWCGLLRKTRGVMPSSLMSRLSCWFDAACRSFAGQGVYSILAAADSASRCLCFVFLGQFNSIVSPNFPEERVLCMRCCGS